MLTLHEIKERTKEDIKDCIENEDVGKYPEDRIHEIVDGNMPIYTFEILEVALSDIELAAVVPEVYGFDGSHNAVNAITGNLYDEVYQAASEYYYTLTKEKDDVNV